MTKTFNIDPYYDDFEAAKNYHKILFKPGVSVQARELTQLQTILQDQIQKFGNHIFKQGSVVIPGNSLSDLSVPYVKVKTLLGVTDLSALNGKEILGKTTGIKAFIRKAEPAGNGGPITLYIAYRSGGTDQNAPASVFADNENILVDGNSSITIITEDSNSTGLGSLAFINDGVYYVNGMFVTVNSQSVVIDRYSQNPSCHVLLKINESVVDSDEDASLLDPAQGTYNYSAPGADRHKVSLTLTTLPLSSTITDDYVEIMRYNNGVLEEHSRYPKYNELEKSLARRTYDESGDYVVDGLKISVREHLNSNFNNGVFDAQNGGDRSKFVAEISAGKAYIQGFENEKLISSRLELEKGRSTSHIKSRSSIALNPRFGQYLFINKLRRLPDISNRTVLSLRNFDNAEIGTARILSVDLHISDDVTPDSAIFRLYVSDIAMNPGKTTSEIVSVYNNGIFFALVCHKINVPVSGASFSSQDTVTTISGRSANVVKYIRSNSELYASKGSSPLPESGDKIRGSVSTAEGVIIAVDSGGNLSGNAAIIELPFDATYRVRRQDNTVDFTYTVYKQLSMSISGGAGSASVVGMTIDPFEQGNTIAVHPTLGVIPLASNQVVVNMNSISLGGLGSAFNGGEISVIVACTKTAQTNKSKTLISYQSLPLPATNIIQLPVCDVFEVLSIRSGDGDVTDRYELDNGQRDYAYLPGSLRLKPGKALPTSAVSVSFNYFTHSGSGDYFSIDSYESSGLVDYYDRVPKYKSGSDGKVYNLTNCLDFRPRINAINLGDQSTTDLVQIDSRIVTSVSYFVPRIDLVVMNKSGKIEAITGIPAERPSEPKQPTGTILLGKLKVPAYTSAIKDIEIVKAKNNGYTMAEIAKIEDRIFNLEQYSLLNESEKSLVTKEVIDAKTGLTRFKSGYLVETFDNPDIIGDVFSTEFKATYVDGFLLPQIERNEVELNPVNFGLDRTYATLPFTQTVFAQQPLSSRVTNVNPFAVYSWTGRLDLTPLSDSWVETEFLPAIFNTTTTSETVNVEVSRPWDWQPTPGSNFRFAPRPAPVATGGGGGGGCFIESAVVELSNGKRKCISDVRVGDLVFNYNKTEINEVKFIEIIKNNDVPLFSLYDREVPFATINHPLYIDGVLCAVDACNSNYTWLGEMADIVPHKVIPPSGETVYNLWVDGDGTYRVNKYGTTSIIGDGGWLTRMFESGILTQEEVTDIMLRCSINADRQIGALMVNKFLEKISCRLPMHKFIAWALKTKKDKFLMFIFEQVGKTLETKQWQQDR